ncbi:MULTISPECIES: aldo/keto reductase [unclassified Anabaena]|uniref:aldo/keto reductase n=1 Tax=unclassified Anabaena TaxID=2619674 RepID=UPI0014461C2C|nr:MULTISPECIES: aldo/keto reductase [unclassified Anabaena]MTJ08762.1 aldo/keto reductase [Anabaena sp. UHCC 0204]MTJ53072.1 aldo/keto reductase [Anabaena sp. UHCC 0253]
MEMKQLGNTNVQISELCLGAMGLSLITKPPEAQAIETIHRALDLGINIIDTADSYCKDESDKHHNERLIHKAFNQYNGDTSHVLVATKGGYIRPQGEWVFSGSPEHLRQTIRESFEALGGDKPIDIWQHHRPDPNYTIEQSLTPVKEAVAEGIIRFVGLSNYSVEEIKRARDLVEVVAIQHQLNPWYRHHEFDGVLNYSNQEKLTFLASSPFGGIQGVRRTSTLENLTVFTQVAQEKGISIYNLMLAWLRTKSVMIVPIIGASKPTSVEASVDALTIKLSDEEVNRLDRSVPFNHLKQKLRWVKKQLQQLIK